VTGRARIFFANVRENSGPHSGCLAEKRHAAGRSQTRRATVRGDASAWDGVPSLWEHPFFARQNPVF
jgi:hypothetical protein